MSEQIMIPKLNPRLYKNFDERGGSSEVRAMESGSLPYIDEIYKGKDKGLEGGIYRKLRGHLFDNKCFPDPDIINRLNIVKSDLVTYFVAFSTKAAFLPLIVFLLTPKKWKIEAIERFLNHFLIKANRILTIELPPTPEFPNGVVYSCFYEDPTLYCTFSREILKFGTIFLSEWGIAKIYSEGIAELIALFFDQDDRYRLTAQDPLNESRKEDIYKPREIRKLGHILLNREQNITLKWKAKAILTILSFALYLPSVRKAFKKALNQCNFNNFQMDKADRYYALPWKPYNFFGKTLEERTKMYLDLHKDGLPPRAKFS